MSNKNNNKGFTLIELIIAMSILSIVSVIGYNIINKSGSFINIQQYITKNQSVANLANTYISKDIEESKSVSEKEKKDDNTYIYTITKVNNSVEYKIELGNKNGNKVYNLIRDDGNSSVEIISNQIRDDDEPFLISLKNNEINLKNKEISYNNNGIYEVKISYNENGKSKKYSFDVSSRLATNSGGNTSDGESGIGSGDGNTSDGESGIGSGDGNTSDGESESGSGDGNTSGGESESGSGDGNTSDGENGSGNAEEDYGDADIIIELQRNYEQPQNSNQFHMTNTIKVRDGENSYRTEGSATGNDFSEKIQIHFSNHINESPSNIKVMVQPKIGDKRISYIHGKDIKNTKKIILTLEGNIYLEQKNVLKEIIPNKQYELNFTSGANFGNNVIISGLSKGETGMLKINLVVD